MTATYPFVTCRFRVEIVLVNLWMQYFGKLTDSCAWPKQDTVSKCTLLMWVAVWGIDELRSIKSSYSLLYLDELNEFTFLTG